MRYFDASALVKRYVREERSQRIRRLLAEPDAVTSRLSEAEVSSAVARRTRDGDLDPKQHAAVLAALRADLDRIHVVELVPEIVSAVHPLLLRHRLRAADALHLATALTLRMETGRLLDFVVHDERLAAAAYAEGFSVVT